MLFQYIIYIIPFMLVINKWVYRLEWSKFLTEKNIVTSSFKTYYFLLVINILISENLLGISFVYSFIIFKNKLMGHHGICPAPPSVGFIALVGNVRLYSKVFIPPTQKINNNIDLKKKKCNTPKYKQT